MNDFNLRCYNLLKRVPKGKVTTYAEIARALNSRGYRAVGNAMNRNKNIIIVPCHRVVRNDGKIGGYSMGIKKKIEILKKEGVNISSGKIDLNEFGFKLRN